MKKLLSGEVDTLPPYEFQAITLTGKIIDVESTPTRTIYNNEDVVLLALKDITKSKEMKQKLMEAEEKFRILSQKSLVGVYIQEYPNLTYVNSEIEKILGYTTEELLNINILDLFVEEDRKSIQENTEILFSGMAESLTEEYSMVTKIGKIKNVEIRAVVTVMQGERMILGTLIDRTKEKNAEKELKNALKNLEDLKFAIDVSTLITITDKEGKIIYVNDKFCARSGYTSQELIGVTHDVMHTDLHTPKFIKSIWDTISSGKVWKGELKYYTKNKDSYWVDTTLVPFLDEQNQPYQFIGIQYDITEKVKSQSTVQQLAYFDSLTGLMNRNSIDTYLDETIWNLNKETDILFVLFIDFDRFQSINDVYGHKFGDLMLIKAAEILDRCACSKGRAFRYGGDEIIIILNNV